MPHKCQAAGICIASTGCCTSADCPPNAAGQTGTCDTASHTCNYSCSGSTKSCTSGSTTICIPATGCCTNSDCSGTCMACDSTSHACVAVKSAHDPNGRCAGTCDAAGACRSAQGQTCTSDRGWMRERYLLLAGPLLLQLRVQHGRRDVVCGHVQHGHMRLSDSHLCSGRPVQGPALSGRAPATLASARPPRRSPVGHGKPAPARSEWRNAPARRIRFVPQSEMFVRALRCSLRVRKIRRAACTNQRVPPAQRRMHRRGWRGILLYERLHDRRHGMSFEFEPANVRTWDQWLHCKQDLGLLGRTRLPTVRAVRLCASDRIYHSRRRRG